MEWQNVIIIEEIMGEPLRDPEVGKDLLNTTHKVLIMKEKVDKLDYIEIKA